MRTILDPTFSSIPKLTNNQILLIFFLKIIPFHPFFFNTVVTTLIQAQTDPNLTSLLILSSLSPNPFATLIPRGIFVKYRPGHYPLRSFHCVCTIFVVLQTLLTSPTSFLTEPFSWRSPSSPACLCFYALAGTIPSAQRDCSPCLPANYILFLQTLSSASMPMYLT